MAYTLAQNPVSASGSGTSVAKAFASNVTAHSLLIAMVTTDAATPGTFNASGGGTWIFGAAKKEPVSTQWVAICYCLDATGGAPPTISVNWTGAGTFNGILIAEFTNGGLGSVFDTITAGSTGTSTTPTDSAMTLSGTDCVVSYAVGNLSGFPTSAGSGFTLGTNKDTTNSAGWEYALAATSSITPTMTATSQAWGIISAAFKSASVFPTLVASYNVNSATSNTTALTTASFTPAVGEIIVVKAVSEDSSISFTGPSSSAGSVVFTSRMASGAASNVEAQIWTGPVTSSVAMTISGAAVSSAAWHSMTVERWSGAQLAATPATNSPPTGSGAPSTTLTTTAANSIVTWCSGDWSAQAPTSRAYLSSATEDGIHDKSTAVYVSYFAYQSAASAGAQTLGMSLPSTQTWALVGIEVQSAFTVSAAIPPLLVMATRRN